MKTSPLMLKLIVARAEDAASATLCRQAALVGFDVDPTKEAMFVGGWMGGVAWALDNLDEYLDG